MRSPGAKIIRRDDAQNWIDGYRFLEEARRSVLEVLRQRHAGEEDVTVLTQDSVLSSFEKILKALTAALAEGIRSTGHPSVATVESARDLDRAWFLGRRVVGLTAVRTTHPVPQAITNETN